MTRLSKLMFFLLCGSLFAAPAGLFSQTKSLDAKFIASNYYKGVVKILLYDSAAAKTDTNSAYIGRGSGFIVSEDGLIFTNRHVVEMCVNGYLHYDYYNEQSGTSSPFIETYNEEILGDSNLVHINRIGYPVPIVQVYYGKGEEEYKLYYAKIISVSTGSFDGAVLKIVSDLKQNPAGNIFQPVPIGNSDSTFQGEDLCIYGYPAQYEGGFNLMLQDMSTLTFGKHSGFDYVFNKDFGYIKTDAAINSGNSGGPVFNQENKVIGIATAAATKTNIGLVGGINAMYYIVSRDIDALQQLSARGLKMPKTAGAIKTIEGKQIPALSQKQIDEINKKKQTEFEARKKRIDEKRQAEAMNAYSAAFERPKIRFMVEGGVGASTFARGNLDVFWQSINADASLKATGAGSPFIWHAGFQSLFATKKEGKVYAGFGAGYFATGGKAISVYKVRDNVVNEVKLGLRCILMSIPFLIELKNKLSLSIEPGFIYMGFNRGTITAYGYTYKEKSGLDMGWYLAGGINKMFTKYVGIAFRAGYRSLTIQETHADDRSGSSYVSTYSFFANGTDGETTFIKWNGFYGSAGIVFMLDRTPKGVRKNIIQK